MAVSSRHCAGCVLFLLLLAARTMFLSCMSVVEHPFSSFAGVAGTVVMVWSVLILAYQGAK